MKRKIAAVITDVLGERVVIGDRELKHALEDHFPFIPQDLVLELLERILKDPTEIFQEDKRAEQLFRFYYRIEGNTKKFVVVVVKTTAEGSFFAKYVSDRQANSKKVSRIAESEAMKKPKISFRKIGDSGPLSLTWVKGPLGEAVEATNGIGVGFFSPQGKLRGVEFDNVNFEKDQQRLTFRRCTVAIEVDHGKISYQCKEKGKEKSRPSRKRKAA